MELYAVVHAVEAALPGASWLVGCGSLPDGAPAGLFAATLADRAHAAGVQVAVDSSGASLVAALAALAARHNLIKPNLDELAQLVGRPLDTLDDVVSAAEDVLVLLIAAPAGADDVHVTLLSKLARRLVHESFRTVEVGVMIEVPSAALAAERIAPHVDFFSVGTNDLLQYLFTVDRLVAEVAEVADLADVCEPLVLDLIGRVVTAAEHHGAWVGVCGETASDPEVAAALVGLGVRELSMVPGALGVVKDLLRRHDLSTLRTAAERARQAADAADARTVLAALA